MKKKKWRIFSFMALAFIPLCLMATGCSLSKGEATIVDIKQTDSEGLVDVYTITYSDGTTEVFTVTNGKDGENGTDAESISVEDLFNEYKKYYGDKLTYEEFLDKYLSLDVSEENTTKAINKSLLSTALVYTEFYEQKSGVKQNGLYSGSSVVWKIEDDYTYFLTNFHVIYDDDAYIVDNQSKYARSINLYLYGSAGGPTKNTTADSNGYYQYTYSGSNIVCEFVGGSISTDLAVIRAKTTDVKEKNSQVREVELAENYHIGETAIAIGNAEGKGLSVTRGVVSVGSEEIKLDIDKERTYRELRIDTSIYHGNSGGGLFNKDGKLIGITNAGDGTDENINYAIPISVVRGVAENLLYYCVDSVSVKGSKVLLGVTVGASDIRYQYDTKTGYGSMTEVITVEDVSEGSITKTLGLEKGDKIIALTINGTETYVDMMYEIGDLLFDVRVNGKISIRYIREGEELVTGEYVVQVGDLKELE